MTKASTFSQLFNSVKNKIANDLYFSSNIQDVIAEKMHEKVKENVYDVYEPKVYERRGNDDGLLGMDNMEFIDVDVQGNSVIFTFTNTAQTSDGNEYLAPIIENGVDGGTAIYQQPRPFTDDTMKQLEIDKSELQNAFKKDLKNIGFKVK